VLEINYICKEMENYCANGCGIVSHTELKYINGMPYCPMCAMSGGKKYEKHGEN
jgi:hypothetical protein